MTRFIHTGKESMKEKGNVNKPVVWAFRWAPPFAQGLVRDLRVRWALEEVGQAYDVELIDFNDRQSTAYLQMQPFGMVPAFEIGGKEMFESAAIVHRIAVESELLMPAEANARAEVLSWMFSALNTVEPPIQNLFELDLIDGGEPWVKLRRPGVVETVMARLQVLSNRLEGRDYLIGQFNAADILMATVLRFLRHTDLVGGFPVVDAYLRRCETRPAFQKALRSQMADFASNTPVAA
jgi:glutathione S-transferase